MHHYRVYSDLNRTPNETQSYSHRTVALNKTAAEFFQFYNSNIKELMEVVEKMEECEAKLKRIQQRASTGRRMAVMAYGAGAAVDVVAAVFTGGASLLLPGAGAALVGSVTGFGVRTIEKRKTKKNNKIFQSLWEKFSSICSVLRQKLQDVRRGVEGMTPSFDWVDLKFRTSEALSCLNNLRENSVADNCDKIRQFKGEIELLEPLLYR